ncbi:MAG: beta-ketoacyl-ACP synthase II [Lachnospirales bacterium]
MEKRVVVTGYGVVSPIGNNVDTYWENMQNGVSGIDHIKAFDNTGFDVKFSAEVKDFVPKYLDRKEQQRFEKFCQYAMEASGEAIEQSGLDIEKIDQNEFGVIIGTGIGGLESIEKNTMICKEKGQSKVSVLFIPQIIVNMVSGSVAIKYGAKGSVYSPVTACATGTNSIGEAFRSIKHGYHKVMLAGGSESSITPTGAAGFTNLKAMSKADEMNRASVPFDKERSGFVIGEGAGILLLEELEYAKARGANILGEIVGYGSTCDAYHITSPDLEGEGARRAMENAIKEAGINCENVGYINAHGTSTPINDKVETKAIKDLFKDYAYKLNVSSTKSMLGHGLGAAGGLEAVACLLALKDGSIPPTINYKVKDEECDLDYTPVTVKKNIQYALSNSLGFGGHNAVLCFKKWEDK